MNFYTTVFRQSGGYWVGLCLENGIVGQGRTKDEALVNLQDAIASVEEVSVQGEDVYSAPVAIRELHEFLTIAEAQPAPEIYELRTVYA